MRVAIARAALAILSLHGVFQYHLELMCGRSCNVDVAKRCHVGTSARVMPVDALARVLCYRNGEHLRAILARVQDRNRRAVVVDIFVAFLG